MEELKKEFEKLFCKELLSYEGHIQGFSDTVWSWIESKIKDAKIEENEHWLNKIDEIRVEYLISPEDNVDIKESNLINRIKELREMK